MKEIKRPKVGVGVIVKKDGKILMQKRKNAYGSGCWSFPGGHMEWHESVEKCAKRETKEEMGVNIKNICIGPYTNDISKAGGTHYITLFVVSDYDSGTPTVCEPDECECWGWFEWEKMPQPLFLPIKNLLKLDFNPFKN